MRRPKDRDFVETREGFFFCLIGYHHPPDRYTAYLKYTPATVGKWARGDVFYRRELPYYHVRHVLNTVAFLEQHHPQYVWVDPTSRLKFSFVPKDAVAKYYVPEERLAEILIHPGDSLEAEIRELVWLLMKTTGLPATAFGLTGSVLLGLHNPAFSDVDLLVYGAESAGKVRRSVMTAEGGAIQVVPPDRRRQWRVEIAERFSLPAKDAAHLEARRWNYFLFRGRNVSIHAVRSDNEIRDEYGSRRYRTSSPATIEARITDATESMFLPAVYRLADVRFLQGEPHDIQELISFEGLYSGVADPGDRLLASGQMETDDEGSGRLVVGSASLPDGGFIRVLPKGQDGNPGLET